VVTYLANGDSYNSGGDGCEGGGGSDGDAVLAGADVWVSSPTLDAVTPERPLTSESDGSRRFFLLNVQRRKSLTEQLVGFLNEPPVSAISFFNFFYKLTTHIRARSGDTCSQTVLKQRPFTLREFVPTTLLCLSIDLWSVKPLSRMSYHARRE